MTPSDADTISQVITNRITFLDGGSWEDQSFREDPRWGDTALAPIAALVGAVERIRYAGGFVGRPASRNHLVTVVSIVVFTDDMIIRAEAEAEPETRDAYLSAAKVWAVPRSSVKAVHVKRSSRVGDKRADSWPNVLDLEVRLDDGTTIPLPLNPEPFNRDYSGLQELAQGLLHR